MKSEDVMDQETRWLTRYKEVMAFIEANHRNPSKHRIEEHDMLNWVKANRKVMNAGKQRQRVGVKASAFCCFIGLCVKV